MYTPVKCVFLLVLFYCICARSFLLHEDAKIDEESIEENKNYKEYEK